MREDQAELQLLQDLIDESVARASPYLREAFTMPEHTLSARQLVRYLEGAVPVAVATVNSKGDPQVVPIHSIFVHGRFFIPTVTSALRVKHLQRNDGISLAHYVGEDLAIVVHGKAALIPSASASFNELERIYAGFNGSGTEDWSRRNPDWGSGIYIEIVAKRLISYARWPERYPE
jgi:hypothetical protein